MNSWSIEEKMGHVLRDLNVQTLLSVSVGPNLWDSTRNTLAVRLTRYSHFLSYSQMKFTLLKRPAFARLANSFST